MKASLVSACAVPPPGSSPAALEAALQTRLQEMARTKAAVEQELLQCRAQLDRAFAVTEQIAGLRDPDDIEEALLGHYGAMLHAGGVYLDRAGCTRRVGLSPGAMPPVDLVPADVRAALARHIESVRIGRKTIVVPAAPELGGAHVLLGAFARPGAEAGVVVVLRGRGAPAFETSDVLASESMLLYGAQILNNALTMCHLQRAAVETVYALVNAIDAKDNYTSDHSERVGLLARLTGQTPSLDNLEGLTLGLYEAGKRVGAGDYLLAKMTLNQAARGAAKFHQSRDLWLTATLGSPPVKLGTFDLEERDPVKAFAPLIEYVPFTAMQNVTGQPAINLPLYWNEAGLPIGVQFVAPFGDELTLLQLATQLEQAQPWFARYATIKL